MINDRKFSDLNDTIDFNRVEEWCEEYFQTTLAMLNVFFGKLALADVIERLRTIPVAEMAAEQLENELDDVKKFAAEKMQDLLASEIEYYKAYAKLE